MRGTTGVASLLSPRVRTRNWTGEYVLIVAHDYRVDLPDRSCHSCPWLLDFDPYTSQRLSGRAWNRHTFSTWTLKNNPTRGLTPSFDVGGLGGGKGSGAEVLVGEVEVEWSRFEWWESLRRCKDRWAGRWGRGIVGSLTSRYLACNTEQLIGLGDCGMLVLCARLLHQHKVGQSIRFARHGRSNQENDGLLVTGSLFLAKRPLDRWCLLSRQGSQEQT